MKVLFISLSLLLIAGTASALNLPIPPGVLITGGVSCGGVAVTSYIEGFNADGNPVGELKGVTRCSQGGRGGRTITHTAYRTITWDFFGGYVLSSYDGGALNSTEVAVDAYGNTAQVAPVPTLTINYLPPGAKHIASVIPPTYGQTQAAVSATLVSLGFIPAVTYTYSSGTIPRGLVLYTIPAAGLMEPVGTLVQVIVSAACDGVTVNCD